MTPRNTRIYIRNTSIYLQLAAVLALVFLAACSEVATPTRTPTPGAARAAQLTPYLSPTPSLAAAVTQPPTAAPQPSVTPTPRTHTVKKGEDMGGIAWQYRVSVEELMAANPTVSPNMMSIGTQLIIPPSKTALPDALPEEGAALPSPTPVAVQVGPLNCAPGEEGGLWCFLPVLNPQAITLESLSALVQVDGSQGEGSLSRAAFPPLDRLPPGSQTALSVYFTPQEVGALAQPYTYSAQMLTALPGAEGDGRYLPVRLENQSALISESGLSAAISADALLEAGSSARRLWVAAAAYDARGQVIGVRRWEMTGAAALESGKALPVSFWLYSTGGAIERVDLQAEARP